MFTIAPHPQKRINYALKALLCTHIAFPYTTREVEIKLTWAEPFELNTKFELGSNFINNESRCLRSLKGE